MSHPQAWGGSRKGPARRENQDRFALDPAQRLFVLSDGMGGHAEGARAAQAVVEAMLEPEPPDSTHAQSRTARLRARVLRAHDRVCRLAARLGHAGDMGATLVALWLARGGYTLATVGDSRAYLWRAGRLLQLNEDHTLVQQYLRQGLLTPEQAASHPQAHVLTQAMGVGEVTPDLFEGSLEPGDRFLLSSDGAHGVLPQAELGGILAQADSPRAAGEELLARVASRGGDDDATVVVIFNPQE